MGRRASIVEYALCPAPVPGKRQPLGDQETNRCLNRLPCEEHKTTSPVLAMALYGHMFIERYHPPRRPLWRRLTRRTA